MDVGERKLTPEEYRNSGFELYQEACFWDALDHDFLTSKGIDHIVVLDVVGALTGSEAQEFYVRIQRLTEHGEQIIVVNLQALTYVDSMGLSALIHSIATLKKSGGTIESRGPNHCRPTRRERLSSRLH